MTYSDSLQAGFTKQGQAYGLSRSQCQQLFKKANAEGLLGQLGQGVQQAGNFLGDKAEQGMNMFKDFRAQNPAAVDAGIGGLAGAGIGAMAGGPNNRGTGALAGGALGAGIGGLGMHPQLLQQYLNQQPQQQPGQQPQLGV